MLIIYMILSVLIITQLVTIGLIIKLTSSASKQPTISNLNSQLEKLTSENKTHIESKFKEINSAIDTILNSRIKKIKSSILKQREEEFHERILPQIKDSLSPESLTTILKNTLNDKTEVNEWGNIISNNPEDFHLMEIAVNKYAGELELSKEVYEKLFQEYKEEKNIGIKRELLKLLDTLTENMLVETSPSNYEVIREMKISVEKLYSDLTSEIKKREISVIQKKIAEIKKLFTKVKDIETMSAFGELTHKINKIDSSIDINLLRTDEKLSKKYDNILNELSDKIDKARNEIVKKENSDLIKKTEKVFKEFNEAKKEWGGNYPEHIINTLVAELSIQEYDNLLPSTYEYSEKIRVQLVDKLNDQQKKEYAVKSIDHKFNGSSL